MHFIDILIIICLGYGIIKGLWKGFFYEMAGFVALGLGIFVAIQFSNLTHKIIESKLDVHGDHLRIIAFIITFFLTVIGIKLLAKIFTQVTRFAFLGIYNTLLGGLFGGLKMLLFLSIFLNIFSRLNQKEGLMTHENVTKSKTFVPITEISKKIYPILNEWFPEIMEQKEILKKAI